MKGTLLSILVLLTTVLVAVSTPMAAQEISDTPTAPDAASLPHGGWMGSIDCFDTCPELDPTARTHPVYSDTALIQSTVQAFGNVEGHIYDANTGDPLAGYVYIYDADDPGIEYGVQADENGYYYRADIEAGTYDIYGSMIGWYPVYATLVISPFLTTTMDFHLPAPVMEWDPQAIDETLDQGDIKDVTLSISNTNGSGDLLYRLDEIAPDIGFSTPSARGALSGIASGVDPKVYEELRGPDDVTEILVVMAEQADLSAAYDISDWSARGWYVYDRLKATADRTQAKVRNYLDGLGIPYRSHISLNSLTLAAPRSAVDALAAMPEVYAIRWGYTYDIPEPIPGSAIDAPEQIPWNIGNIEADRVWDLFGVTGEDIVVASIDTGVEWHHEALINQYRGWDGIAVTHDYNWWDPRGACEIAGFPPDEPCDNHSHGTHTMGSMVGSDDPANPISATNPIGVAPGARWMACKGCEYVEGWACSDFALLECADFVLAPWDMEMQNPDPDLRPHVVNNSWGGSANDGGFFAAVAAWRAAGIFPAFAAGNFGPQCHSVASPGDYYNAFASGAVDHNDYIAGFSSRGPSQLGLMKPEVSAPGVNVVSSVPGGSYGSKSGTSMASPHSAGELALIWSAQPDLVGQVQLTEWLMEQTADPILNAQCGDPGPPNYVYGWGRINAYNAVSTALAYEWGVDWLAVSPDMGTVTAGDALGVNVALDATGWLSGCYTATLKIETNDPYQGLDVFLPVELCVTCHDIEGLGFAYEPPASFPGGVVTFTAAITAGGAPIYTWNFGDGQTGTGAMVTHVYTEVGDFDVVLTAENPCDTTVYTGTVTVLCVEVATATISGPAALPAGTTGTYTVTLEPPNATEPIDVEWSNGTTGTSTTYSWDEPGDYTVVVTGTNCEGTAMVTDTLEVTVIQPMHYVYLPIVVKDH